MLNLKKTQALIKRCKSKILLFFRKLKEEWQTNTVRKREMASNFKRVALNKREKRGNSVQHEMPDKLADSTRDETKVIVF